MKKVPQHQQTAILLRVQPDTKAALARLAEEDDRTITALVHKIVKDFIRREGHDHLPRKISK